MKLINKLSVKHPMQKCIIVANMCSGGRKLKTLFMERHSTAETLSCLCILLNESSLVHFWQNQCQMETFH